MAAGEYNSSKCRKSLTRSVTDDPLFTTELLPFNLKELL